MASTRRSPRRGKSTTLSPCNCWPNGSSLLIRSPGNIESLKASGNCLCCRRVPMNIWHISHHVCQPFSRDPCPVVEHPSFDQRGLGLGADRTAFTLSLIHI